MTTTPNEPIQDPDVVPAGDPIANPVPAQPGEDPGATPDPDPHED